MPKASAKDKPAPIKDDLSPRSIDVSRRLILPEAAMAALGVQAGDYVGFKVEGKRVILQKAVWRFED